MGTRIAGAPARTISGGQAARLVKSGMWLDYGATLCQPDVFDKALAARLHELKDIKVRSCLSMRPRAVMEADPRGERVYWLSWHFSGYDRRQHDAGRCGYMPVNLGEIPDYYRRFLDPIDVVVLKTCPMDEHGYFNFGVTNLWHRALIERAKLLIVEVTRGMPYGHGVMNGVHLSEVDYILEGDDQAPPELPNPPPTEIDRAVARHIAAQIEDGACLQIGIGAMPNAVCTLLLESGVGGFGVHTEMLTDGMVELYRAGRLSGAGKRLDPGKVVYSFAVGSSSLYSTIDRNTDFLCYPVDYTNSPHIIMRNDRVISINNTTQIDLQGQVASESDGHRHLSGTGGQLQFVRGAYASKEGKSFICLSSTYSKRGEPKSRIVLNLTTGNVVTTPRSDTMYVVTEYGMVNLKGQSVAERARGLIGIAHPDFRETLEREAYENRLIPRGFSLACSTHVAQAPRATYARSDMSAEEPTTEAALLREQRGGIVTLRLNRPAQLNALSAEMLDELQRELDSLAALQGLRCVVIAAAGKAFCAGHDLSEMQQTRSEPFYQALFNRCSRVMEAIRSLPVPVIARVQGLATAAGCQLVAACDLAIASESARFAVSGINVGLFCSTPSVALSRNVSTKRAFDMLVTGRFIEAATAVEWGLINEAVPAAHLDAAIDRLTAEIAAKSPAAIRYGKIMFYRQQGMALRNAYEYASDVMARNMMEDDANEGIEAFLGKRRPVWRS